MIDDLTDEPEYDEGPEEEGYDERVRFCKCGAKTIGEQCGFCGEDLCPSCFSAGGGFCGANHTQEQIDAYEDDLLGPEGQADRDAQRKRRDELKALGILP